MIGEYSAIMKPSENNRTAKPSEGNSMVKSSEDSSMVKPSEDNSMVKPSEDNSMVKPSEDNSLVKPSEDNSMVKPSRDNSMVKPSKDNSMMKPSEDNSMVKPSEDNSMVKPSEKKTTVNPSQHQSKLHAAIGNKVNVTVTLNGRRTHGKRRGANGIKKTAVHFKTAKFCKGRKQMKVDDFANYLLLKPDLRRKTYPCRFAPFPPFCKFDLPMIDYDLQLLFCWIPKNACSELKALFCRHENTRETPDHKLMKIHNCSFTRPPIGKKKALPQQEETILTGPGWTNLAIVRHPFDRFASGYLDKVQRMQMNDGCEHGDIACFVEHVHYRTTVVQTHTTLLLNRFRDYIVSDHFAPQFWFCDFQNHISRYELFKLESDSLQTQLTTKLKNEGWPAEELDSGWSVYKNESFLWRKSAHAALSSDHEALRNVFRQSLYLTELHLQTYLIDYVMFDYELPEWTAQLCNNHTKCKDWISCLSQKDFKRYSQIVKQKLWK